MGVKKYQYSKCSELFYDDSLSAFLRRRHISHMYCPFLADMKESIKSNDNPIQYQLIRTKIVLVIVCRV